MTYYTEIAELLAAIIIGVLFSIFISAFFILVLILRKKTRSGTLYFMKNKRNSSIQEKNAKPEIKLLKPISPNIANESSEMSILDDFCDNFYTYNGTMQDDPKWVDQASNLISHCLAVLMHCKTLTEKLTSLAMNSLDEWDPHMAKLVEIAKVITLRVDQFVCCMRPPLNPSVLEARAASLTLAVTHLAIMTQFECPIENLPAEWVSKMLSNIQKHIEFLNEETEKIFQSKESMQFLHSPINIHN